MKDRKKFMRRLAGILQTRLPEIGLDKVKDPRPRDRRRRWRLACILQTILVSMFAGAKSLADCEQSSELMSRSMQRLLGIRGRLPDTTCRDILGWLDVEDLRACIHRMAKHAHRRRATLPQGLPFGVLAMDGKYTCIPKNDEPYSQKKETAGKNPESEMGMVRTITSALVSSAAKICIDVSPIPVKTNEMGHFAKAFTDLVDVYGRRNMFRVITADAGYASEENAQLVVSKGYDFLFRLNTFQPTLLREAQDQLAHVSVAVAQTQDGCKPGVVIRRLYLTEEMAGLSPRDAR